MRTPLPSRLNRFCHLGHVPLKVTSLLPAAKISSCIQRQLGSRTFANVRDPDRLINDVFFTGSTSRRSPLDGSGQQGGDHMPPDERTIKLGKTIRTLHERLPSLLEKPLPQDILSPHISLHLFPSTHAFLPTVSGRIAYTGALWTAPVAWGRVPVVGNVKITVLSERMVRNGGVAVPHACREEKLIVKWKTCGKDKDNSSQAVYRGVGSTEYMDKLSQVLRGENKEDSEFCGLFVFEFDEEGRISKHTIEHAEEGGNLDRATRVVSVTDWLLGRAPWRRRNEEVPGLAWCETQQRQGRRRLPPHRNDHER